MMKKTKKEMIKEWRQKKDGNKENDISISGCKYMTKKFCSKEKKIMNFMLPCHFANQKK